MKFFILRTRLTFCFSLVFQLSLFAGEDLRFRENKGQVGDQFHRARPDILFSVQVQNLSAHFRRDGYSFQLSKITSIPAKPQRSERLKLHDDLAQSKLDVYRLDLNWLNSNPNVQITTIHEYRDHENFYSEVSPLGALNVKSYGSISYQNLYEGVDLRWYTKNGELKYDYIVAVGADYKKITWELKGAKKLSINKAGELIIETPLGNLSEAAPEVFQAGKKLQARWVLNSEKISFEIKNADPNKELVIDPLIRQWGTYYGGSAEDLFCYTMSDKSGNAYISAQTQSSNGNIATVGAYQTSYGGAGAGVWLGDGLLIKMDGNGNRLWATFYGGAGSDRLEGLDVDLNGNIYVGGVTTTTNSNVMTTPGAHQTISNIQSNSVEGDGFIVKFNSAGARIWSTYYGDVDDDWVLGISLDPNNNLFVSGGTYGGANSGTVFATPGAHQSAHSTGTINIDAFFSKFTSAGLRLWSTYYGGPSYDETFYCKADTLGNVYFPGQTSTTIALVIASAGAHQSTANNTPNYRDAFLVKFNGAGTRLWGTYYGGLMNDYLTSCSVDASNQVIAFGSSENSLGTTVATPGTHQALHGGGNFDAFVVKFSPSGLRRWGTYYGGTSYEEISNGTVARNGDILITGVTTANTGTALATCGAYQSVYGGGAHDQFFARFDSLGLRKWGSFFGGFGDEKRWGMIALDAAENLFLGGSVNSLSTSSIIASTGAYQTNYGGGSTDFYFQKFDGCLIVPPVFSNEGIACAGQKTILTANAVCGLRYYSDPALTNLIYSGGSFTTNVLYNDTTFYVTDASCGSISTPAVIQLTASSSPTVIIAPSQQFVCIGGSAILFPTGANSYTWAGLSANYSVQVSPTVTSSYSVTGSLLNGCKGTATITMYVDLCSAVEENDSVSGLAVFPNPASQKLFVQTSGAAHVSLFSANGAMVFSKELKSDEEAIDISSLPKGIYLVLLSNEKSYRQLKVVIE